MINEFYAKQFCSEDISLIENYDLAVADVNITWHCHHKLELELHKSRHDLISVNLYYNRPASELIFLTPKDHHSLHHISKNLSNETRKKMSISHIGHKTSLETRKKMSKVHMGCKSWNRGKTNVYSQKTLLMMSNAQKGKVFSEEHKKKLSEAHTGKPLPKNKWKTPDGDIIEMSKNNVMRFHKDWILIE